MGIFDAFKKQPVKKSAAKAKAKKPESVSKSIPKSIPKSKAQQVKPKNSQDSQKPQKLKRHGDQTEMGEWADLQPLPAREDNRLILTVRTLCVAVVGLVALCLCLIATIFVMMPLKQPVPYVVTYFSEDQRLVHLEPHSLSYSSSKAFVKDTVLRYTRLRNDILPVGQEMTLRWFHENGYISAHSAPRVLVEFHQKAREIWNQVRDDPFYRHTEISKIRSTAWNIWELEITTRDTKLGTTGHFQEKSYVVDINLSQVSRGEGELPTRDEIERNPLQLLISHYDQRENSRK